MFTADNMRFLLELSRTGRIADAAKRLDVDQTTVSRRITRLEKDMERDCSTGDRRDGN